MKWVYRWGQYLFDSINTCLNQCNATNARTCQLVGEGDPLGSFFFQGLPVPFKIYTETINLIIGPNVNVNQSNIVTLRGELGLVVCAPNSHMIDNPNHNFTVIVEGVTFQHCAGNTNPTWDYTSGLDDNTNLQLSGNIFDGASTLARPFDGIIDSEFLFTGNYLTNYSGDFGVRFIGRACNTSNIVITLNTFISFRGANLEVIGFDNMVIGNGLPGGNGRYNNGFFDAGGSTTIPPTQRYVVYISTCNDQKKGTIQIAGNIVEGHIGTTCVPPLWSGYFIDPLTWFIPSPYTIITADDTKLFHMAQNFAGSVLCIAMRFDNTPLKCNSPDQQGFLREEVWYKGPNNGLIGQAPPIGFGLYIGPYNAAQENTVLFAPLTTPDLCKHCEEGCPRNTWDLLGWIVGGTLLALLVLCCCCFFVCPGGCFLCPRAPTTFHDDGELGQMVPDNRSSWLTFIRYAPSWNQGRPWRPEDGAGAQPLINRQPVQTLDQAATHNAYATWGRALHAGT